MFKTVDHKLRALIFALAFLMYANTLRHNYAWDDSIVILENPYVQRGFAGIPELFQKKHSDYKADKYGYRPIVLTSFAIEYGLFKQKPAVGHFMNVVYFALLCAVMFTVLRKIFFRFTNLPAFLVCLFFVVHPIHVEVVANIKSRDEIFALLFCLLSLSQLINYARTSEWRPAVISLFFFLLAFLSKENSITFLAVMPLTLVYLDSRINWRKWVRPGLVILVLLLLSLFIYKLANTGNNGVNRSTGAGIYHESGILGNSFFYSDHLGEKLANAFTILALYLKNFFYPVRLLYYYGYNQVPVANWGQSLVIFSLLLHLALLLYAVLRYRVQKEISFGIFFYFATVLVYTHLIRTFADTMADRFLFMPSLGLCIALVFLVAALLKVDLSTVKVENLWLAKAGNADKNARNFKYVFTLIFILLAGRTWTRNRDWKDNMTLVSHDLPYLENCARAHLYYANNLRDKLNVSFDKNTEDEMIKHFRRAIQISDESYYAYIGLATYLSGKQRYAESIVVLDEMMKKFSEQADPNFYLGQDYFSLENYDKAVSYLEKSLRLAPAVFNTYYTLSVSYSRRGDFEKALRTITTAQRKFGESSFIYEALGNIYFDKGDLKESTRNTLEMLRFGTDAKRVYGVVIGRLQYAKQDSLAAVYYNEAVSKGIFQRGSR